jgi:hypothetical protein
VKDWTVFWLALIALSTLAMALVQVWGIVHGARTARRLESMLGRVEEDLKPILQRVQEVSAEASRMSTLASAQVERIDRLFGDLATRVDHTASVIQNALVAPAREGWALVSAVRATVGALRGLRRDGHRRPSRAVEEDDALFIG